MRQTFFAPAVIGAWLVVSAATAADDPLRYYKARLSADVWGLAESTFAPWSTDFKDQPRDPTKLVPGESTIIFRADRIEAPDPFGCAKPKYEFKMITADKLFGGRLEKPAQEDLGFDARISSCSTRAAVWTCYKRLIGKSEPAIAASYRKIQRAWIAYRDARCAHPQIEFQGSMAGPMEAFCQMQATADQSLWLGTGED